MKYLMLGILIPFLGFMFILFFLVTTTATVGKNFEVPVLLPPLRDSEINFILSDSRVDMSVTNTSNTRKYTDVKEYDYVLGITMNLENSTRIVSPINGDVDIKLYEHSEQVEKSNPTNPNDRYYTRITKRKQLIIKNSEQIIYIDGMDDITISEGDVTKGETLGRTRGSIYVSRQLIEKKFLGKNKIIDAPYYPEYLYWSTRENIFPLMAPTDVIFYAYTSPFGERSNPFGGSGTELHSGQDIAIQSGIPVFAVEDGVIVSVKSAKDRNSGGNRVYLLSKDGDRKYGYLHLLRPLVEEGMEVKKGDRIALSGNSGRSTGPHLHFSFFDVINNTYIDPAPAVYYWEKNMDWELFLEDET